MPRHIPAIPLGVTLGGVPHVHAAMIEDAAGLQFHYVGFEGTGARIRALVGDHIDAAIGDIASSLEFVKNGNLRFLAVGSDKRLRKPPTCRPSRNWAPELNLNIVRGRSPPRTPRKTRSRPSPTPQALQGSGLHESSPQRGRRSQLQGPEAYSDY